MYITHNIHRGKIHRGENSDICLLGRTVRADILGWIFLGSQKSSQMAAYVCKSNNENYSVDINNLIFLNIWSTIIEYNYNLNLFVVK